jgi:hypothetical protein
VDYTASWLQICNRALARLSAIELTDIDEGTANASFCKTFLPEAVEEVLAQYGWTCCRKRLRIEPLAERPAFGWEYQFPMPNDYVRLVEIWGGGGTLGKHEYQAERGKILANFRELRLVYIAQPDEAVLLSPGVRKAVEVTLAFLLTTAITSSEQLAARLSAERAEAVERARTEDAQESCDPLAEGERWYRDMRA